jgi:NAD-dependent deacetylase
LFQVPILPPLTANIGSHFHPLRLSDTFHIADQTEAISGHIAVFRSEPLLAIAAREDETLAEALYYTSRVSASQKPPAHFAEAAALMRNSRRITVFTGAGVSAESGVPTFRDQDGFWNRFPPKRFAHWAGLNQLIQREPLLVAEFVSELVRPIITAKPNPAHRAIADLEKLEKDVNVVTQNIDGLHQRAGSAHVVEIHGSLFEVLHIRGSASSIAQVSPLSLSLMLMDLDALLKVGQCTTAQLVCAVHPIFRMNPGEFYRPNIVLFGDVLPSHAWNEAVTAASACDCLLIVGTSQLVYPAAGLPAVARSSGAKIIGVGLERCECDVPLFGAAGGLLPNLVSQI